MAIEIVDLPIKNDDFPQQTVSLPEGILQEDGSHMGTSQDTTGCFLMRTTG